MGKTSPQPPPTARNPLSAQSLCRDFAWTTGLARRGVSVLADALQASSHPQVQACLEQWLTLFGKATGRDLNRPIKGLAQLAECCGAESARPHPQAILFALHTYFALVVSLLVCATKGSELLSDEKRSDPFSWYTAARCPGIEQLIGRMAAIFTHYDPVPLMEQAGGGDLLKPLYQGLFPRALRHELGEYYTPDWLADHVLDQVGYTGHPNCRLLDPACGSGTFLVAAIRRVRASYAASRGGDRISESDLCRKILENVVGYDINPTAVLAARANYLIALGDLLRSVEGVEIPVVLCDSILDGPPQQRPAEGRGTVPFSGRRFASVPENRDSPRAEPSFDTIAGNPPWIAWDNLPADYRRATRPLWERYGLFSLSGNEGRHGGAKKDLAMLMIYATADRYLKRGGRLGMVVTQTAFQTKGAGDGFRRFRLGPQGDWLKVLRVDDMAALRPFPGVANWTSTILLEKGEATRYPVPYFRWTKKGSELFSERGSKKESAIASAENSSDPFFVYQAEPIERGRPSSPWFLRPAGLQADLATLIGPSDYTAHLGANSGGANGVYWVTAIRRADGGVLVRNAGEKGNRQVAAAEHVIEPQLLYPLLRWGDVARYRAVPSAAILLAQDVTTRSGIEQAVIEREYPRAYAYLQGFERLLSQRAAYRRYQGGKPFYSMYNVGPYTVAPIKVVWRRMDRRIRAAVVEEADDPLLGRRPVVPQETCVLIAIDAADAAHYVCAVLNSAIAGFLVAAHSVAGGKGFGTPGVLDFIRLRRFDPEDARHAELAALSRAAHAAGGVDVADIQCTIDRLAAELWGLEQKECAIIEREMKLHP